MQHPASSAVLHTAEVADRASFAQFVGHLLEDFLEHPDEWENISLHDFLEAMQMHALDIMRQYHHVHQADQNGAEQPNWRQFADLLLDARVKPM